MNVAVSLCGTGTASGTQFDHDIARAIADSQIRLPPSDVASALRDDGSNLLPLAVPGLPRGRIPNTAAAIKKGRTPSGSPTSFGSRRNAGLPESLALPLAAEAHPIVCERVRSRFDRRVLAALLPSATLLHRATLLYGTGLLDRDQPSGPRRPSDRRHCAESLRPSAPGPSHPSVPGRPSPHTLLPRSKPPDRQLPCNRRKRLGQHYPHSRRGDDRTTGSGTSEAEEPVRRTPPYQRTRNQPACHHRQPRRHRQPHRHSRHIRTRRSRQRLAIPAKQRNADNCDEYRNP